MQQINNIPIWGLPIDDGALTQITNCAHTAHKAAMMADHHRGYSVPIGGVVAYKHQVSPSAVGYDIACGNKAVKTDMKATDITGNISKIMDDVVSRISFGVGQKNNNRVDHALFDSPIWSHASMAPHKEMARNQLGTVGSGNHYVDIFVDEDSYVWVGCHFGSRGIGHKTATYFLENGGALPGDFAPPLVLDVSSNLGAEYLACLDLCGDYAYAGRDWVCDEVLRILGAKELDSVHNHHNSAWQETHGGEELIVIRKGATPAFPGQRGFVGGSMCEPAVILEGVEHPEAALSLYSTVHGAGRVLGRAQAKGKVHKKTGEIVRAPLVSKDSMTDWVQKSGIVLRGADVDEAPQCYKRLPEVLEHHRNTIRILHTLTPIGVAMAGNDTFDPYKD